jgi:hypothetical protein
MDDLFLLQNHGEEDWELGGERGTEERRIN